MLNVITKSLKLEDGREITIETGKLAKQADGAVVLRMGNTMLLATVVAKKEAMEGVDFLPLSVDYQEKFASAGKIPGGFLKREGMISFFIYSFLLYGLEIPHFLMANFYHPHAALVADGFVQLASFPDFSVEGTTGRTMYAYHETPGGKQTTFVFFSNIRFCLNCPV